MKKLLSAVVMLLLAAFASQAQTLVNLAHQAPDSADVQFLLTDGTVLVQGFQGQDWYKLTPDINGSYVNGTWTQVASLAANYDPYAFASQTLSDGRVLIEGGEYNFGQFSFTNLGAVYDPVANTWTPLTPPPGFDYIGDSPSVILPNGHFLIGRKFDMKMADLDPATMTWTSLGSPTGKADWNAEEGWTLMPNGTILTADVLAAPNSEHYIPSENRWVSDGSTIANLMGPPEVGSINYGGGQYCPPGEIGPAILRPDGSVFATGALHTGASAGHTAILPPRTNTYDPGTWFAGPDFPTTTTPMTPSPHCCPTVRFSSKAPGEECTNSTARTSPGQPALPVRSSSFQPERSWLAASGFHRPAGAGLQIWAPLVTNVPTSVQRGQTYRVIGRQFNGMSQAAGFGDEFETATNYPLVRIKNNATGHIFFAKTHDHSTRAVQTKAVPTYTMFDVPANMETGPSTLNVVTNGLASNPTSIMVN